MAEPVADMPAAVTPTPAAGMPAVVMAVATPAAAMFAVVTAALMWVVPLAPTMVVAITPAVTTALLLMVRAYMPHRCPFLISVAVMA